MCQLQIIVRQDEDIWHREIRAPGVEEDEPSASGDGGI